jgi:hypothetical protein
MLLSQFLQGFILLSLDKLILVLESKEFVLNIFEVSLIFDDIVDRPTHLVILKEIGLLRSIVLCLNDKL